MRYARFLGTTLSAWVLALALGCSGSDDGNGSVRVTLVDGPINGFLEVKVNLQRLEISGPGGWTTLAVPNKTVDLLTLTGGVTEVLTDGTTLPEGRYQMMRLVLGPGNSVKLADGTVVPLETPSALQSGLKLPLSFAVEAGTTKDVWIDFDAARSIQIVRTGASSRYILRPTIWAYDKLATGSVSGTLTANDGAPLAGATVTAQVFQNNQPVVVRTVQTRDNGGFTLDLLPVGGTFHVVSQPVVGSTAYEAKASGGFAVSTDSPTFTYNAAFAPATATGTVTVGFNTPAGDGQHDLVDLVQTLNGSPFVVRSGVAVVASGTESLTFDLVPTGTYTVRATRVTLATDGSVSSATATSASFSVASGGTSVVSF